MDLNERALEYCARLLERAADLRVGVRRARGSACVIDCGVEAAGGLEAGLAMAEISMAGWGRVALVPAVADAWPGPAVQVATDQPVAACMASQYAGWQISLDGYFAIASGPMRAARGAEPVFESIGWRERPEHVVGVLEARHLPPPEVCALVARECGVAQDAVTLLVAPTASTAGAIQVVARTVETCLHKMHTLGWDLACVQSGFGTAPLPPVAADDLVGIGRTNDAVLYGGSVILWVRGDDDWLQEQGARIPSASSADYGVPFLDVFERYDRDFYKIDPLLFSPARVTLINLDTGRTHRFGELRSDVLRKSFTG